MTLPLVLFLFLPGLLLYAVVLRSCRLSHSVGLFAASWLFGEMLITQLTYVTGSLHLFGDVAILQRTTLSLTLLLAIISTLWIGYEVMFRHLNVRSLFGTIPGKVNFVFSAYVVAAISFGFFLYEDAVIIRDGWLFYDYAYWDFTAHYPIIQNFVYGDNFPAGSEIAAGLPMVYHFLHDLMIASYVTLGASLPGAIFIGSVLPLTALFVMVFSIAEQLFRSQLAGVVAGMLLVTSCNLRWVIELFDASATPSLLAPFLSNVSGYEFSFLKSSLGRFNFSMFNIFYFVVERHLMFACGVLAAVIVFLLNIQVTSLLGATIFSLLLVNGVFWHSYLIPVIGVVVGSYALALLRPSLGVTVCAIVGGVSLLEVLRWRGMLHSSTWFAPIQGYPRFNLSFGMDTEAIPISFFSVVKYWIASWGVLLSCASLGALSLVRLRDVRVWLLIPGAVVTFLLINTVQVMTTPVYENHKWVKMLQVLLAILAGGFVSRIATSGSWRRIRAALLLVALLTVPGGIEAIPFIHGGPQVRYAEYPKGVVAAVRENTSPRAVFVSQFTREILLAGRKVYVTNRKDVSGVFPYLSGTGFRIPLRTRYNELLFKSPSIEEFCRNIRVMKVDVVEFSEGNRSTVLYSLVKTWPSFSARNQRMKQDVVFVHTTPCSGNL